MNRLVALAALAVVIILVIYGVSASKSLCSDVAAEYDLISGPQDRAEVTLSESEHALGLVPCGVHTNETSDLTLRDYMDLPGTRTVETREDVLTQIELIPMDPQGNRVTFASDVVGLPKRAHFDPQTNTLSWRPWYTDAGAHEIVFKDVHSDYTQKITVHVEDVPLRSWYAHWLESKTVKSAMVKH
jgi:hypothetical protein